MKILRFINEEILSSPLLQKIYNFRIPISLKHLRLSTISTITLLFVFAFLESIKDGEIIWKEARNESGELSYNLLIFIIFISLSNKLFPKIKIFRQLLPLRKEAGISVFLIVFAHAIFHFLRAGVFGDFEGMYFQAIERDWAILLGTISFVILIPLFLTSTAFSIKKMGIKSWNWLHKLTHIVFILSSIHIAFLDFTKKGKIDDDTLIILTIYILGYIILFIKNVTIQPKKTQKKI